MARLTAADIATLQAAQALIERLLAEAAAPPVVAPAPGPRPMAWGQKVSPVFRARVRWICDTLFKYPDAPDDLMSCMAWESGRTFSPGVKNMAGSGATGLIQFMPATAAGLGTTTDALAKMSAEDQLNFVYKYFRPYAGRVTHLSDLYMCILYPKAVGQPDDFVMFEKGVAYRQNAGLDINKDSRVTKAEAAAKVYALKAEGLKLAA